MQNQLWRNKVVPLQWICSWCCSLASNDEYTLTPHGLAGPSTVLSIQTHRSLCLPNVPLRKVLCYRWGTGSMCPSLDSGCLAPGFTRIFITDEDSLWWRRRQKGEAFFRRWGGSKCSRQRDGVDDHTKDRAGRKQTPVLHRRLLDPFQWSTTICRGLGAMKIGVQPQKSRWSWGTGRCTQRVPECGYKTQLPKSGSTSST